MSYPSLWRYTLGWVPLSSLTSHCGASWREILSLWGKCRALVRLLPMLKIRANLGYSWEFPKISLSVGAFQCGISRAHSCLPSIVFPIDVRNLVAMQLIHYPILVWNSLVSILPIIFRDDSVMKVLLRENMPILLRDQSLEVSTSPFGVKVVWAREDFSSMSLLHLPEWDAAACYHASESATLHFGVRCSRLIFIQADLVEIIISGLPSAILNGRTNFFGARISLI